MGGFILGIFFLACVFSTCFAFQGSPLVSIRPELEFLEQITAQERWKRTKNVSQIENLVANVNNHLNSMALKEKALGNVTDCVISLLHFGMDLAHKKPYALQVADSFAKPPSGLLLGNIRWPGRFDECRAVKSEYFNGKWCALTAGEEVAIVTGVVGLSVGFCIPDTCSEADLNKAIAPHVKNINLTIAFKCPVQPREAWTSADILSMFAFCLLLFLVSLGSIVDFFVERNKEKEKQKLSINADEISVESDTAVKPQNPPLWMDAAASFSIIKNTNSLLSVTRKPGTIDVLHGMRFISITWVALGHCYIMTLSYMDNIKDFADYYMSSWTFQTIANATFSVDTFFFLGGLLVAYIGMKEKYRFSGKMLPMLYVQRYLRLTPAYAFMILFTVGFYGKLSEGPYWPDAYNTPKDMCVKYWWTNLLYINNFYPVTLLKECYALGWYLANDTQFFFLAPFSLLLLRWRPKVGLFVLIGGLFSSMVVTGIINSHYNMQAQPVAFALLIDSATKALSHGSDPFANNTIPGLTPQALTKDQFFSDTYTKPWCRIGVYLIGMMTGYILQITKFKLKMSKLFAVCGWLAAATIIMSLMYGAYPNVRDASPMDISLASFYNVMGRPLWGLGLAWVVIACSCGYGGPINTFLCWSFFVPLSKLTFCFYLVHPVVLSWWFGSLQVTSHFTNLQMAFNFMALVTASVAMAYVLCMLVEMPFVNLSKLILTRHFQEEMDAMIREDTEALVENKESSLEQPAE